MEGKIQKALVIKQYGTNPILVEDSPIPTIKEGELLVKLQASTINPSDKMFLKGFYMKKPLPATCGFQGTGTVVQANGENLQSWVGKRVCFLTPSGSWAQYAVSLPVTTFQIDKDVPIECAASGIVNPLTVIGMVQKFKQLGHKGIIHTAAASALGRMLNKLCQKRNIPLLNIVRKKQQAQLLKKEGAKHVIVTEGDWANQYKQLINTQGFDCVYDALGGGPVTQQIIAHLKPKSTYHLYGGLQGKQFTVRDQRIFFAGLTMTGYMLTPWWLRQSEQLTNKVRAQYSDLLKNQLSTYTYKQLKLNHIEEAIQLSVQKATQGKILLKIE